MESGHGVARETLSLDLVHQGGAVQPEELSSPLLVPVSLVKRLEDQVGLEAVEEAEQKSGVEIKEVCIGIAGQHIKSLQHRGELVRDDIENEITFDDMEKLRENMFKLVTVPGEEVIHVIPQEYTVDGGQQS